jgi:predicted unusual protein kinase regulating ubiquinone biosynthesis (AarF/ABC1/UbiB family)
MMEQYHGMSLGEVRDLSVSDVAHEIEDLFYRQPFRIPAQFAFSGRAIGTLSGLATGLAPEFNLVKVAIPYAQKFLGLTRDGASQNAQQLLTQALDAGRTMLTLPATLERVLAKVEAGQIEVRLSEDGLNGSSRGRSGRRRGGSAQASGGLSSAAIVAVSVAAGAVLMMNQLLAPGWFCLAVAGVAALSFTFRR